MSKDKTENKGKTFRRQSFLLVALLLACLIFLNVVLAQVVGDKWQFDLTANQLSSLGEVSKQVLRTLDTELEIYVLASKENYPKGFPSVDMSFVPRLLDQYVAAAPTKLSLTYVEPVHNPQAVESLDPQGVHNLQAGDVVITTKDKSKLKSFSYSDFLEIQELYLAGYTAEQQITGAIKFLSAENTPTVYFSRGHGEASLEENFTIFKRMLEQNNYLVQVLEGNLASVPADCDILIMLDPTRDITSVERELYQDYLDRGGALLVLLDHSTEEFVELNQLLASFDLKITSDRVKEQKTDYILAGEAFPGAKLSSLAKLVETPYFATEDYDVLALTVNSRVITTAGQKPDFVTTYELVQSSDEAVREIAGDPEDLSPAGVQNMAMYATNEANVDFVEVTEPAEVVVFGSASMFSDSILSTFYQYTANYPLLYRNIQNLSSYEPTDLLISPKPVVSYAIKPSSQNQIRAVVAIFLLVVPLVFIILAIRVYRRRRYL